MYRLAMVCLLVVLASCSAERQFAAYFQSWSDHWVGVEFKPLLKLYHLLLSFRFPMEQIVVWPDFHHM